MIRVLQRFTPLQRALHWLMAACILTMFFVGVGMVSTTDAEVPAPHRLSQITWRPYPGVGIDTPGGTATIRRPATASRLT